MILGVLPHVFLPASAQQAAWCVYKIVDRVVPLFAYKVF
jgi:hypothetical protein